MWHPVVRLFLNSDRSGVGGGEWSKKQFIIYITCSGDKRFLKLLIWKIIGFVFFFSSSFLPFSLLCRT